MNIPEYWNDGIARMTTAEVNAFAREAHGKIAALTRDLEEARADLKRLSESLGVDSMQVVDDLHAWPGKGTDAPGRPRSQR